MTFIIDIIAFLVILGVVVLVHELGHFLAAKSAGVKVEEFGIGFPPKLWKKKIGETEYSIGAIPLGGFNKIYGMDEDDEKKEFDSRGYDSKGAWAKFWICSAGIVMNVLFAAIIFYGLLASSGLKTSQALLYSDYKFPFGYQTDRPMVAQVEENSPAAAAGLKPYDTIVAVNGEAINGTDALSRIINANKGKTVDLLLGDGKVVEVIPRASVEEGQGPLGVALREVAYLDYSTTITDKIFAGFEHSWNIIDYSFSALGRLAGSSFAEKSIEPLAYSMTGPVGIYAIIKVTLGNGWYDIMNLVAVLSIALGISNLLPIPAMDGAKMIYTFLEAINKKVFSKKLQLRIESYGAAFLILLAVAIIFKDFIQFKDIIFK